MKDLEVNGFWYDFRPLLMCEIANPHDQNFQNVIALVDTGSTDCIIRSSLVRQLGLKIEDVVITHNVGISAPTSTARVDFRFYASPHATDYPIQLVRGARALISDFDPCSDIVLGMNVLQHATVIVRLGLPTIVFASDQS